MRITCTAVLACLLACACTKVAPATDAPVSECTKTEQRCVFSDGKIGLCTASTPCDGGSPCLVCMSLH
jgi:hypothetical protein